MIPMWCCYIQPSMLYSEGAAKAVPERADRGILDAIALHGGCPFGDVIQESCQADCQLDESP